MLNSIAGVELNKKGFLVNFDAWNKDVAKALAKKHDLELGDCHWKVINFMRDYFMEYGIAPEPREVIAKLGGQINPLVKCTRKHLEGLFGGDCKQACQIAGLPDTFCRGC